MSLSWARVLGIVQKELRDYRRNRFVIVTMAVLPLLFVVLPLVDILSITTSVSSVRLTDRVGASLLYMILIPAIVPSTLSAYSVVGEREQGTLEAVLITPIRRDELLIGKALAVMGPALVISYAVFGVFLGVAAIFAHPEVTSEVFEGSHLLVQLLFTPLVAGWSIWVGIAISTRSVDVRAAQQLGFFASLPPLGIVALLAFGVIAPTLGLAVGIAAGLLIVDVLGWRAVAAMFDRERLITAVSG